MRRDMDLIRKMVLFLEDHPSGYAPSELQFEGYTRSQIGYYACLLVDAGLAVGSDVTSLGDNGPNYRLTHLNSAGHDFAENARNQYVWDEVTQEMKDKGVIAASIDIVSRMLDKALRRRLDVG
jgi:Hypothetical protein (DUF2513)